MQDLRTLMILLASLGAAVAMVAALGKFSGRLGDRTVDRLYVISYGCAALSVALFVMHGLFSQRP